MTVTTFLNFFYRVCQVVSVPLQSALLKENQINYVYHVSPYIQFEQFRLNDLSKQYLETVFLQKLYKIQYGVESYTVDFAAANLKSVWLEISSANDKSLYHYIIVLMLKL